MRAVVVEDNFENQRVFRVEPKHLRQLHLKVLVRNPIVGLGGVDLGNGFRVLRLDEMVRLRLVQQPKQPGRPKAFFWSSGSRFGRVIERDRIEGLLVALDFEHVSFAIPDNIEVGGSGFVQGTERKEITVTGVTEQNRAGNFRINGYVRAFEGADRTRKHDRRCLVLADFDLVHRPVIEWKLLNRLVIRRGLRERRNGKEKSKDY